MKSKGISMFLFFLLVVLALPGMAAEFESNNGHISFIENQATITRSDLAEHKAVVNLPLVPGDTIVTSPDGRCELQFDNGTVIRLDKNSRLRITTVQAPTLTSRWKITTLHLLQGQMYTLPQTYGKEMFQIITPNAAVKLTSRTAATIRFNADLSTTLFSDAGKFEVLYGADNKALKKVNVKSGQSYVIDVANSLAVNNEKRNLEFVAWNEYVDRHFKDLHFGISKVPPKLKFGSSALQYWAEHWSSLYGEWIYDELFGYVWKPASEQFARFDYPFFTGDLVRVNGQLFLVPQENWGWVPAHMGTWVWLKTGWTWIPGNWFHSGITEFFARNGCFFRDFHYYFWYTYGDFYLYNYYRTHGRGAWREIYYSNFHKYYNEPPVNDLPSELQKIIKRINNTPLTAVAEKLITGRTLPELEARKMSLSVISPKADLSEKVPSDVSPASGNEALSKSPVLDMAVSAKSKTEVKGERKKFAGRDWNPDISWAAKNGYSINYSSSRNAVFCPELKVSSDQKQLRTRVGSDGFYVPGQGYIPVNSSQSSTNGTTGEGTVTKTTATADLPAKKDDSGK